MPNAENPRCPPVGNINHPNCVSTRSARRIFFSPRFDHRSGLLRSSYGCPRFPSPLRYVSGNHNRDQPPNGDEFETGGTRRLVLALLRFRGRDSERK